MSAVKHPIIFLGGAGEGGIISMVGSLGILSQVDAVKDALNLAGCYMDWRFGPPF